MSEHLAWATNTNNGIKDIAAILKLDSSTKRKTMIKYFIL